MMAAFQPVPIPSLVESGVLPSSHASGVMTAQRKQILQLYKTKVVLPILQAHDDAEYDEAASGFTLFSVASGISAPTGLYTVGMF